MVNGDTLGAINDAVEKALQRPFRGTFSSGPGGGCINDAGRLTDPSRGDSVFIKWNRAGMLPMFETEALGLEALAATSTMRVPYPICFGVKQNIAFLALEWLDLRGTGNWFAMGEALAKLHSARCQGSFGWERDNFIGTTSQMNTPTDDWDAFFTETRLAFQVELAESRGGRFPRFPMLRDLAPAMLAGHDVRPSLVHGDLWSGNAAFTENGEPVIFDPAVYRGDAEVDLAMSAFFGGFPKDFYEGHASIWEPKSGQKWRRTLYNLYHALNHFNLFGGHYQSQANQMIDQLLVDL